jgi:hypothetical protein
MSLWNACLRALNVIGSLYRIDSMYNMFTINLEDGGKGFPKRYRSAKLHDVTTQKIAIFIFTAARTSDFTKILLNSTSDAMSLLRQFLKKFPTGLPTIPTSCRSDIYVHGSWLVTVSEIVVTVAHS